MVKYIKPSLKTKFHIDFGWWIQENENLRRHLLEHACLECREMVEADPEPKYMDWIDPETGQVFQIDQLWHLIRTRCSEDIIEFIPDHLSLVASIFRLFIANNNTPLTPVQIHQQLQRKSASLILRTIGGRKVYMGIRPVNKLVNR